MNFKTIGKYAVLTLFSAFMLFVGVPKLLALPFILEGMKELAYSVGFIRLVGLFWTLAAIGVWIKKTRSWTVLATFPLLGGIVATHVMNGDGWAYAILPILPVLILGLLILYIDGFYSRVSSE